MDKHIPIELNEENVMQIYNDCLLTEKDLPIEEKDILKTQIFTAEACGQDSPVIVFKTQKIKEYENAIEYMYGQLGIVHSKSKVITPSMGVINYNANFWTKDNRVLTALYYLGVANITIMPFVMNLVSKELESDLIGIKPTYSPNDPKFTE